MRRNKKEFCLKWMGWSVVFGLFLWVGPTEAKVQEQIWNSVKLSSGFAQNFKMGGELLHRYSLDNDQFVTRAVRFGVGYTFKSQWVYMLTFENRMASSNVSDEIRILHDISKKWKFQAIHLSVRGRFEQREFSSSPSFSNRLRVRTKADSPALRFWDVTPFSSAEFFYTANEIPGRPAGATEFWFLLGVSFKALDGKLALAYMNRRSQNPEYQGKPSSETVSNIADLSMSWSY